MTRFLRYLLSVIALVLLSACAAREEFEPYDSTAEYEAFLKSFDAEYRDAFFASRIRLRLLESAADMDTAKSITSSLISSLENLPPPKPWPAPLDSWLAALESEMKQSQPNPGPLILGELKALSAALSKGDKSFEEILAEARARTIENNKPSFFTFATTADIPTDLKWETNLDAPEIGSPEASKGGTYHQWFTSFPPSLRIVGPDSNNSFRGEHYDNIEMGLVEMHPDTGELIPGIADRWAVSPDGRTVHYHIDPAATYSDGNPIVANDTAMTLFLQLNPYVNNPFGKNFYREQFTHLTIYNERVFSVTLRQPRPLAPISAAISPTPREFYKEIGPDFEKRYDWRSRPTTGAYMLHPDGIVKGTSITLHRVEDWWAKDRRYRRHRFNADRIEYRVIRDLPKAWEIFRRGDLDGFPLSLPEYWYERSEVPEVFNGFIHRHTFFNVWPSSGTGFYLNTAKPPLDNLDIRIGISFACDWQRVIEVILRGDAKRANSMQQGFVLIPDADVTARPYDPGKARDHFAKAGYTIPDADGILKNANGERLSVAITFANVSTRVAIVNLIAEQAKKAGIELRVDAIEGTTAFQKAVTKQHQLFYTGWGFSPPLNDYHQFLHSSNAFEKDGRLKTNTNNLFSFKDPRMDALCDQHRAATSLEEIASLTNEIEKIIFEQAVFVPSVVTPFTRQATWRWICWPETLATAACYVPFESYVWWIDAEKKKDTLDARVEGRTFPEVMAMKDHFKNGPPPAGNTEPAPPPPLPLPES